MLFEFSLDFGCVFVSTAVANFDQASSSCPGNSKLAVPASEAMYWKLVDFLKDSKVMRMSPELWEVETNGDIVHLHGDLGESPRSPCKSPSLRAISWSSVVYRGLKSRGNEMVFISLHNLKVNFRCVFFTAEIYL